MISKDTGKHLMKIGDTILLAVLIIVAIVWVEEFFRSLGNAVGVGYFTTLSTAFVILLVFAVLRFGTQLWLKISRKI